MYKVIRYFTDLQDNDYPYYEGDTFPRDGMTVTRQRLEELASKNNKQRVPLIEKAKSDGTYTKTEINRMSTAELRELAAQNGIAGAEQITGAELKKILIQTLL